MKKLIMIIPEDIQSYFTINKLYIFLGITEYLLDIKYSFGIGYGIIVEIALLMR